VRTCLAVPSVWCVCKEGLEGSRRVDVEAPLSASLRCSRPHQDRVVGQVVMISRILQWAGRLLDCLFAS
jgi:hypothetical protein